jgi:dienelactone hydrolase
MNILGCVLLALTTFAFSHHLAAQSPAFQPQQVVVPSGSLRLTALLWLPKASGAVPAVFFSHGAGRADPAGAHAIGPVFARHGYAFLYLFRRGAGLSAGQGDYMGNLLEREAKLRGEDARRRLQLVLLTTDHLDDVTAGIAFLKKNVANVDSSRVAVAGHSFGGQLTLLAAERDKTLRAAVTFATAAVQWEGSAGLRDRLLESARKLTTPIFLTYAANDYSTEPGKAISAELARLKRVHELKIYPAVGDTTSTGHGAVYTDIATWERDVFRFLDEHTK